MTETEFLVDRHTHRIVKRDGKWKLYCPRRGPDKLICTNSFDVLIRVLYMPNHCHWWLG